LIARARYIILGFTTPYPE